MWKKFLLERGLSEASIKGAEISYIFPWIRIPYLQESYQVIKGRYLASASKGIPKYIWLRGKPQFPYNWQPSQWDTFLYICEGELDTIRLMQELLNSAGVIGLPFGAITFKKEWTSAIQKSDIKIFSLLDNDEAGKNGSQRIANLLGSEIQRVIWPSKVKGYDLTDFASQSPDNLGDRLSKMAYERIIPVSENLIVRKKNVYVSIKDRNDLEELKKKIPLETVVASFNINLTKTPEGFKGRCPLHGNHERIRSEKNASLFINTEKNIFHCFSCGAGGSSLDFIMKIRNNISFTAAINYLKDNYVKAGNSKT